MLTIERSSAQVNALALNTSSDVRRTQAAARTHLYFGEAFAAQHRTMSPVARSSLEAAPLVVRVFQMIEIQHDGGTDTPTWAPQDASRGLLFRYLGRSGGEAAIQYRAVASPIAVRPAESTSNAVDRTRAAAQQRLAGARSAGELVDFVGRSLGITQQDVRAALGVSASTIHAWKTQPQQQLRKGHRSRLCDLVTIAERWRVLGEGRSLTPLYRRALDGRTLRDRLRDNVLDMEAIAQHLRALAEELQRYDRALARSHGDGIYDLGGAGDL
jgi:hypothetical protein